jgi:hypothetical protein
VAFNLRIFHTAFHRQTFAKFAEVLLDAARQLRRELRQPLRYTSVGILRKTFR